MKNALIVGAGPAGATLAYVLASRGIGVRLVERQRDFSREFRGEGFQPSGLDALRQMGLGEQFASLPSVRLQSLALWRRGKKLVETPVPEQDSEMVPRMVSQPALLEMVVKECERFPNFRFDRGVTVRDVITEGGRVVGVRTTDEELRADIVVGCDGRTSALRRRSGLHEERTAQAFDILWCKLPLPPFWPRPGHAELHATDAGVILCFPSYDGTLQLGWAVAKGRYKELKDQGVDAWLVELVRHVRADLAAHIRANADRVRNPFVLDVVCDRLIKWTAPGLLLIGDAAHPMSPVGGQGVNVALRDALCAANELVPVLREDGSPAEIDAAAARVQALRMDEVIAIQNIQTRQSGLMLQQGWYAKVMTLLIPLAARLAKLRGQGVRGERRFAKHLRPLTLAV